MNCIRRGVPVPIAPVFKMLVIFPNVEDEILAAGFAKIGWLNMLKTSARKIRFARSRMGVRFASARSASHRPGPLPMKRPAFPHVPLAGTANAARLNQLEIVCWAG